MDIIGTLFSIIFWALILALIPATIAKRKGRSFAKWYAYGFCIWIVAFVHSLFLEDHSGVQCPVCKEEALFIS